MLPIRHALTLFLLALLPILPAAITAQEPATPPAEAATEPAPTAGDAPAGILDFSIVDAHDRHLPARLTFVGAGGPGADLFPNHDANPTELAVRKDMIYTLSGRGSVTVPIGSYTVIASHGLEYSIDSAEITIAEGKRARFEGRLVHEIDTTGWVSADFHLHTFTYSGHGDANLNERLISILGEGLEVAVATDHNHHTDYTPTIEALGQDGAILPIVGNEVSTPLGHFNVFPVDPQGTVFPRQLAHGPTLFAHVRSHDSRVGVRTVIQVNHPRWGDIDYFGQVDLDPISGATDSLNYSRKFDSIEVLNENSGWGYYEAGVDPIETGSSRHSVLEDWFNLLDRGDEPAAVGNSDSHSVRKNIAGVPRNYVWVPSDSPSELEIKWVTEAVRRAQVIATTGPFVEMKIDGRGPGSKVTATEGTVELAVRVQAASWIDVDRVIVVVNGDRVLEIPVPDVRTPLRIETTRTLALGSDAWIVLLAEGDDSLAPVVPDKKRPTRPLCIVNPIWVDAEGDGQWVPPNVQSARAMTALASDPGKTVPLWESASPANRRRLLLGTPTDLPSAPELVSRGLADEHRRVRIAACRLADRLDSPSLDAALVPILDRAEADPYERLSSLIALTDGTLRRDKLLESLDRDGRAVLAEGSAILKADLPGDFVRKWRVAGYFELPAEGETPAPEVGGSGETWLDRRFLGKGGEIGWEIRETRSSGYLDLLGLARDPLLAERALAFAEVWAYVKESREVRFTLGTDDGCVFRVNGHEFVVDTGSHGADPLAHTGKIPLEAGWNRLLLRVENGRGGFGAYLRLLDDEVLLSPTPSNRASAER